MEKGKKYKSPINRTIIIGSAIFVVLLCALLAIQTYLSSCDSLYKQYNARLENVITFLDGQIDADDMRECIRTGVPSEKMVRLQRLINEVVDDFELQYLYFAIPKDTDAPTGRMVVVLTATSDAERAAGDEADLPMLTDFSDSYTREEIVPYLLAWNIPEVTYYEESSDYGPCYTACKPIITSDGETVALICADLSMTQMRRSIYSSVHSNTALTAFICALLTLVLIVWLQRNVTGPILALERRAQQFTEMSRNARDPRLLHFDTSDIQTNNELGLLVNVMSQMSSEVRNYVETSANAEARAQSAEQEIEGMFRIAYQDALTRVKNKAAYDAKAAEISVDIATERAEFAIVMVDLNHLKKVNDTYGHENGNQYIVGACGIVCAVYDHSPVYRIGGDEFIAVLTGRDYENREALFEELQKRFEEARGDMSRKAWERYSAAAGMAVYEKGRDRSIEQVFRRADDIMYENKKRMKAERAE